MRLPEWIPSWFLDLLIIPVIVILFPIAWIYEKYMNIRGYEWDEHGIGWVTKIGKHPRKWEKFEEERKKKDFMFNENQTKLLKTIKREVLEATFVTVIGPFVILPLAHFYGFPILIRILFGVWVLFWFSYWNYAKHVLKTGERL